LALSEQEKESMQGQLERILGYVGKLKEVNTDRVAPTAHPYESTNVWREDVAKPFESLDEIFKNAPDMEEKYYKVKRVIE
jgi:aspartyl-tRNA(Asn)/glutamyl-tRNA(Gln) amidotransferase subunit C